MPDSHGGWQHCDSKVLSDLSRLNRQTVTYPVLGFPGGPGGPNMRSCPNRPRSARDSKSVRTLEGDERRYHVAERDLFELKAPDSKLIPPSICPACTGSIPRTQMQIVKPFACPHCNRLVKTSGTYSGLLYGTCYGIPTLILLFVALPIVARVALWIVLAFSFAILYIFIADQLIGPPRLVLASDRDDDFQRLSLSR